MKTEKATNFYDLPHEVASTDQNLCICGRPNDDPMHVVALPVQQAAAHPVLVTEKGS